MAQEEYYEDEFDEEVDVDEEIFDKPNWLMEMPYWAVSAILHIIVILVIGSFIFAEQAAQKEKNVAMEIRQKKKPPKYDPKKKRDLKRTPKILNPKIIKEPVIKRKIDEVTTDIPKGTDLNNLSNVNQNSTMVNDAIGVGGGAAGAYGHRYGKGSLVREGGSEGTESAVLAALEWLYRHQDADGGWKAADFNKGTVREKRGPSSNKDSKRYPTDLGWAETDIGVTSLAILAFTGFGHTHMDGEYDHFVTCLKQAVKYMVRNQQRDPGDPAKNGRYGSGDSEQWIYNHSIATMAMAELLLMSNDFKLKKSVKEATKLCLRAQNDGRGWRYGIKPGDNDTSVTGWMVLALKTAKQCRLGLPKEEFQNAFNGALKWFEYATASNGKTGYNVPGDEGSRLAKGHPDPYPFSKELSCMSAVGVLCRLFAGQSRKEASIRSGVDILNQQPPMWREAKGRSLSTINIYYWYYATYAMFQFGGKPWAVWNNKMQRALVDTQRAEYKDDSPEVDGSWDPIGEWGISGGRVYSTALGAMTLEVYYRFERQQEGIGL
ncbi:MAG: prenyltransferase/squalene oxidase repeat-containing protein [Planctomycetota bacterium]|nr:prenyltransferase/squalene oxidase repeat-containing protein [Planctomycetota bacterium]